MKNFKYIVIAALASLMITSCWMEEEGMNQENTTPDGNTEVKASTNFTTDTSAEIMTYTINREDIESEITTITNETFNSSFLSEYPNAWLTIKPTDSSNQVTFSIMPSGDDDGNPIITDPNKVVCSGGGYSFVSCLSDWFDLNPDGCLVITQSGGSFSANDEGC